MGKCGSEEACIRSLYFICSQKWFFRKSYI